MITDIQKVTVTRTQIVTGRVSLPRATIAFTLDQGLHMKYSSHGSNMYAAKVVDKFILP